MLNLIKRLLPPNKRIKINPKIRLQFKYFWKGFDYKNHFSFLDRYYNICLSNKPDYIIHSCYSSPWNGKIMPELESKAVRIFYTGENVRPDMSKCDYAISFCYDDDIQNPNHFRLPNYTLRLWKFGFSWRSLVKTDQKSEELFRNKSKFCNFIYSNSKCETRNQFFHELSKYKRVDAGGKLFNNMGERVSGNHGSLGSKLEFMSDYKFSIAFENASSLGYTTEKLVEASLAGTVPIYWGNPEVHRDFNPQGFISLHECDNDLEKLRKRVEEVDNDDELYFSYLREPLLYNNEPSKYLDETYVINIFKKIFS